MKIENNQAESLVETRESVWIMLVSLSTIILPLVHHTHDNPPPVSSMLTDHISSEKVCLAARYVGRKVFIILLVMV